jgi:hypothetical protein
MQHFWARCIDEKSEIGYFYDCPKLLIICIFVILTLCLKEKIENKNFPPFYGNLP